MNTIYLLNFNEFYAFIDDFPDKLPRKIVDFPATFDDQQGIFGPRDQAIETKAIGVPQVRLEDFGVSQEAVGLGHGTPGYPMKLGQSTCGRLALNFDRPSSQWAISPHWSFDHA